MSGEVMKIHQISDQSAERPLRHALRLGVSALLLSVVVFLSCTEEQASFEPFPEDTVYVTLRVENVSQFSYDTLYAHLSPELNLLGATRLNSGVIPSKSFTEISWPQGAYLTAVRRLVERGPRVAIRSQTRLTASPEQDLLRLLDEGFVLTSQP